MNLNKCIYNLKIFWKQNSRSILTAGAVVLTVSAVVEAIHATSKAKDIIDDAEYEKFESLGCPEDTSKDYKLTAREKFELTWKCYIWTGLLMSGAISCGIVSHLESNRRLDAATVAYGSLLETYNTYRDNVQKIVKDKDLRAINHGVVHDFVERDNAITPKHILDNRYKEGDDIKILLRDAYSSKVGGGYFKRTREEITRAEGKFNRILMDCGKATINDWYDCLDLGHSELGDYYGWEWATDGPLFAIVLPDDFNVVEDKAVISGIGLADAQYSKYFKPYRQLY